jgi:hypothetical protein
LQSTDSPRTSKAPVPPIPSPIPIPVLAPFILIIYFQSAKMAIRNVPVKPIRKIRRCSSS